MRSIFSTFLQQDLLTQALIANEGELTPELEEILIINTSDMQEKVASFVEEIKLRENKIEYHKKQAQELVEKNEKIETEINKLEQVLLLALERYGTPNKTGNKIIDFTNEYASIRIMESKSVQTIIEDEKLIPSKFITIEQREPVEKISKKDIKAAIDAGEKVPGASLKRVTSLTIK
jgi:hypothetical protein